jgi:RNA polymerase sigma-70 factor (ECF subfamily)
LLIHEVERSGVDTWWTPHERDRVVGLCARLSGHPEAAEDLAQEALLEAWRNVHKLRDPQARWPWLAAIARNVCLRWSSEKRRDLPFSDRATDAHDLAAPGVLADGFDIELELERAELAELLDRALTLVPPETREILVRRYVEGSPQAEVAARLGLSEGAVSMRVRRGKLALQRVLSTELSGEVAPYGLGTSADDAPRETRIWCPICGRRRLLGCFPEGEGEFRLRCPGCSPTPEGNFVSADLAHFSGVFGDVRGYKPALSRLLAWVDGYWRPGLAGERLACMNCRRAVSMRMDMPESAPHWVRKDFGLYAPCGACGHAEYQPYSPLALCLPEVRRFWREHPRMRTLPKRHVESSGVPALVSGFESLTGAARVDVVSACDTFRVLGVYGATEGSSGRRHWGADASRN